MTVNELIALLQALPPEQRELPIYRDDEGGSTEVVEVKVEHNRWPGHDVSVSIL